MLLCKIITGQSCLGKSGMPQPTAGYHSTMDQLNYPQIFIISKPDQILPVNIAECCAGWNISWCSYSWSRDLVARSTGVFFWEKLFSLNTPQLERMHCSDNFHVSIILYTMWCDMLKLNIVLFCGQTPCLNSSKMPPFYFLPTCWSKHSQCELRGLHTLYSCVLLLLYYCCTKLLIYYCCVIFFLVIVIQDLASYPFFDNLNELRLILLHILINLHNRYANLFSRYQM